MKTALIDVGGGMQAAFAAGVLARLQQDHVHFDICIGVSAGSGNIVNFLNGDAQKSYEFYLDSESREKYFNWTNLLKTGSYIDLDAVYADDESLKRAAHGDSELVIVATNALSGDPAFFMRDMIDKYGSEVLKASSSLPPACRPVLIGNIPYMDGGVADLVPVQKALDMGAERIVLLSTNPMEPADDPDSYELAARLYGHKYPGAAKALRENGQRYNEAVRLVQQLEAEGKLLSLHADDTYGVDALTKASDGIEKLFMQGYEKGRAVKDFLGMAQQPMWKRLLAENLLK